MGGWMPFSHDLHPLIGNISHLYNLYLLTGLSSSGFEKDLMAGKLLGESINNGAEVSKLSDADPAR
jgi:glycine/D-amino acid oxidase-like deaminating enzyme